MLTVRLRSRDGLERLKIPDDSTLADLRVAVAEKVERPVNEIYLSADKTLLSSRDPDTYLDLSDDDSTLSSLGFVNGQMIFCAYQGTRNVDPGYRKNAFELRPYGAHMDVERLVAKQVRMQRQEKGTIATASFDPFALKSFQEYVEGVFSFQIKRCGILYGRVEDESVFVDVVFEPEQRGEAERLTWEKNEQYELADKLAAMLGLRKVGLLFNQSAGEHDYIMNNEEIWQACSTQAEVGEHCVIAVFSQLEQDGQDLLYVTKVHAYKLSTQHRVQKEFHLEGFQCSKQAVELWREGWFCEPGEEILGVSKMKHPHDPSVKLPVMVAMKDVDEVDNDFFLVPVAVKDHQGPLMTSFAVENRLTGQANTDVRKHLKNVSHKPWSEKLADFHLLLWLATYSGLNVETDITLIVEAVVKKTPVMEGYTLLIESLAG